MVGGHVVHYFGEIEFGKTPAVLIDVAQCRLSRRRASDTWQVPRNRLDRNKLVVRAFGSPVADERMVAQQDHDRVNPDIFKTGGEQQTEIDTGSAIRFQNVARRAQPL